MMKSLLNRELQSFIIRRISSFTYLNVTQFLGALNDNFYKLLIVYYFIDLDGIENSHRILSMTGAIFVLPFLLFSTYSGTLADRFSKRNIIVLTKVFEFFIICLAIFAFIYQTKFLAFSVLFLLASQSAVFGPSKYGIIPELVGTEKISRANGMMSLFSFLAIVLGTFFASFILDLTGRNFLVACIFCLCISVIGLITSYCIEITPAAGSENKLKGFPLSETISSLKIARNEPSLVAAILGSAFFMFLGSYIQMNIIPFAVQSLHLSDVQGGYLFLITAVGIGTGSLLSGQISGKDVELGLVPLSGIGITICCYLLDYYSNSIAAVVSLVWVLGMLGGIFQVPLDSYIQVASPSKYRGKIIAATNFISFFGVLCASGLLYLVTEVFELQADKGFVIIGTISLLITVVTTYLFFDYFTRFVGMVLSKIHFQTTFFGVDHIPTKPRIYVCFHTAWNDTLLMMGAQRRRLRFFIKQEQEHKKWLKKLYRMLRIVWVHSFEPLEKNVECLSKIEKLIKNDISVCILTENEDIHGEVDSLKKSEMFKEIVERYHCEIVPVIIEKGERHNRTRFFSGLMKKIRVPAFISFHE